VKPPPRVLVGSVAFDPLPADRAVTLVRDGMARGTGGLMLVVGRDTYECGLAPASQAATVVLAGSATTVWASRLSGHPLPARIRATELAESLCRAAATDGRRVFVLGGAPGSPGVPSVAQRVAAVLGLKFRGLPIVGTAGAPAQESGDVDGRGVDGRGVEGTPQVWAALRADVVEAKPDLVLVGTDAVALLEALRGDLPSAWLFSSAGLVDALLAGPSAGSSRWPQPSELRVNAGVNAVAQVLRLLTHAALHRQPAPHRRPAAERRPEV
jgi:N-acetylglucosaminyldiphosphoundecaprenol N-acetyl-beta-D-mannosaminyltransferase